MWANEVAMANQAKDRWDKRREDGPSLKGHLAHEVKSIAESLKFYHDRINQFEGEH